MTKRPATIGQKNGKLTVIALGDKNARGRVTWLCKCDCGRERIVPGASLTKTKSCGCVPRGSQADDLTGRKFGRLTVLKRNLPAQTEPGGVMWDCRCECKAIVTKHSDYLVSGSVKSCGCLRESSSAAVKEANTKHGLCGSRIYSIFRGMHERCENPHHESYSRYGGRGIKVCERWDTVVAFLEDMGHPRPGDSIDRIDVDAGYSPENCRWISASDNSRRARSAKPVKVKVHKGRKTEYGPRAPIKKRTPSPEVDASHFNATHGMSRSSTHGSWRGAMARCRNPGNKAYPRYGGRGISFHSCWDRFEDFFADMGECPPGYSLDRTNNDGNYEPGNCRWVPIGENAKKTANSRFVELRGKQMTSADAARSLGVRPGTVIAMAARLGSHQAAVDYYLKRAESGCTVFANGKVSKPIVAEPRARAQTLSTRLLAFLDRFFRAA